jgi:hypothetical protein
MGIPDVRFESNVSSAVDYDALVVITSSLDDITLDIADALRLAKTSDASIGKDGSVSALRVAEGVALNFASRVVLGVVGALEDYEDVRKIGDVAASAVMRAKSAGAVAPLLVFHFNATSFDTSSVSNFIAVSLLAALQSLYEVCACARNICALHVQAAACCKV